jgi:hypothetical protein
MSGKQALSQTTLNEAFALAMQGHTWHTGRSKVNGTRFYLIPSRSVPGTAHRTTNYGCTCTGYRRRGDCVHTEAVKVFEAGESAARKPLDALNALLDRHLDERTGTVSAY